MKRRRHQTMFETAQNTIKHLPLSTKHSDYQQERWHFLISFFETDPPSVPSQSKELKNDSILHHLSACSSDCALDGLFLKKRRRPQRRVEALKSTSPLQGPSLAPVTWLKTGSRVGGWVGIFVDLPSWQWVKT